MAWPREIGLRFKVGGQTFSPADWPTASWRSAEQRSQLVLSGHAFLPRAEFLVTLSNGVVIIQLSLTARESVTLEDLSILWVGGPQGGLSLRNTAATEFVSFGAVGQPSVVSSNAMPRAFEQVFTSGEHSLHLGVDEPDFVVVTHPDATENALGVAVESRVPITLQAERIAQFDVTLTNGTTLGETLAQVADRQRIVETVQPRFGWRSGAAYGVILNGARTEAAARWFSEADGRPLFLLDGIWFSAVERWRFGPAFPTVPTDLNVDVALAWPALRVDPVRTESIPAERVETTCADGSCVLLNPGRPAVRERIAREAVELAEQGVSLVEIPDIVPGWFNAVTESMSLATLPIVLPYPATAGANAMRLLPDRWTVDEDCPTPLSADAPACLMRLLTANEQDGIPRPGTAQLEQQAWGLATTWQHGSRVQLSPGPIHLVDQPLGRARQWASIVALAGGLYLLEIFRVNSTHSEEIFWTPWLAGAVRLGRPFYNGTALPSVWQNSMALFVFNWSDVRQRIDLTEPGLPEMTSALSYSMNRCSRMESPTSSRFPRMMSLSSFETDEGGFPQGLNALEDTHGDDRTGYHGRR